MENEKKPCVMPEMPYCPICEYGRVEYPEWVETYEDTYDSGCKWVCTYNGKTEERTQCKYKDINTGICNKHSNLNEPYIEFCVDGPCKDEE